MNKERSDTVKQHIRQATSAFVVVLNIILIACALIMYTLYTDAYEERLREENLSNIANLNRSAAITASALFDSWKLKLDDIAKYIEVNSLDHDAALEYISESNSDEDRYFELIGADYTGYLAGDGYPGLDYSHSSYAELQHIFDSAEGDVRDDIKFAPEYSDAMTATKFFAVYDHMLLNNSTNERKLYTLMLAMSSKSVLTMLNGQGDYDGQSTVLIDASGNYIVSSNDYKSANFFQYLYVYNELTLDEKTAIEKEMKYNGSGELYFKNASTVVEDCVFRYERMSQSGWYCVTCVPLSSFREPAFNIKYVVYAIICLIVLFIADIVWLQGMNRRLRVSIQREKIANAAKGNFMSRMSHEIRTPLNAVIGYNTIARSEMTAAANEAERRQAEMRVMDYLSKSDIASKHLLTIINDVLDMSAIESGRIKVEHEVFDFKGLITSLTTVFYSQARTKGVKLEVKFDNATEEWFVGDQMRTNQVLTNLMSNAVKFTPEGGTVTLSVDQRESDEDKRLVHFEVTDTGIGMAEEYLDHLWTPFEQADSSISRRFGGTGLGLSITKNLVDLMGGSITVKSEAGKGTTFFVDLIYGRAEQKPDERACDFSSVSALIVDDDINTCEYIRLLFGSCGAKCVAVNSGADAINAMQRAQDNGETYSVCLVDWQMPGMDGIETARELRRIAGAELPIIVLTAYDYSEIADSAKDVGIDHFISKPLFRSSLFDLLMSISGAAEHVHREGRNAKYDFGGARVLLAEDNAMNMEIAKTIMEEANIVVDGAWNGQEAVDMFEASAPGTYMAILMDVHMPVLNGHDATRIIRGSAHPEAGTIPIIAMTADAFSENVAEAHAAGMNCHIAKPIDIPVLFETLKGFSKAKK